MVYEALRDPLLSITIFDPSKTLLIYFLRSK